MEELYLSSDSLRNLSKLTRYLILQHNVVLKMSDPLVLTKVFDTCEGSDDGYTLEMFHELKEEMAKPSLDDSTSFVFYADERIMRMIESSVDNIVVRDKYGNEKIRYYR